MTDWADNLARVTELKEAVEAEPALLASSAEELLVLAHDEEWSVQRAAVDALGAGLMRRPEAGLSELDAIVRTALDETVPSPSRWRDGLLALAGTAPGAVRDAALAGFEAVPSDQLGDAGAGCVARTLERLAVDDPAALVDSTDELRAICRTSPPRARRHLLSAHLALVDSHRAAVRPVLPSVLAEFEAGSGDTRRVAADLLCALASHPEDGPDVVEKMVRWLATHPRQPREQRRWLDPHESIMCPSLTDGPPAGTLGVTQVLARVAEETPDAVSPHCTDIAASLAAWESTGDDQWPRSHLARALAAVARQQPKAVVSIADAVPTLLDDESEFVRYWAAQALLALYPYRPDAVSPTVIGDLLTDANPDVRGLGGDLATGCVADGLVDSDGVVAELRTALSDTSDRSSRRTLGVFATVARNDPGAVRHALSTLEGFLTNPLTASDAAAVFEAVASDEPASIADAVPTLVDCLFTDSPTVRTAAAETLVTVGTTRPSLLDDQLPVLATVVEQEHAGVDAVGDVLVTVCDRPLDDDRTVFEFVRARSADDSVSVRRTATQLLGAFIEADIETEQSVTALTDRLADTDERVREVALDALATHVAATGAGSLVQSCYRTGTDRWRGISAELLARVTLFDGAWPSAEFQRWLADCLRETGGETRRSFVEAAGYICGQSDAESELVSALLTCLVDDAVAEASFAAVRDVVAQGATTVPPSELAPAVERAVRGADSDIPSACVALVPHVAPHVEAPQRMADRLLAQLTENSGDTGRLAAALAALCATSVTLSPVDIVSALERHAIERPMSARDWTCKNFGHVLRELDAGETFRETFVSMASDGAIERRATAANVLASVADVWPAGVRPAADTLRAGIRDDDEQVSAPALSALVAVGRESPAVLQPMAGWLKTRRASSETVEWRRRRYEGIALLAADGGDLGGAVYGPLRAGLLDNDTAVTEYALEAAAELADPRLVPLLTRLDDGVPDWGALPAQCRTASDTESNPPFADLLPSDERTRTAGDVLDRLER